MVKFNSKDIETIIDYLNNPNNNELKEKLNKKKDESENFTNLYKEIELYYVLDEFCELKFDTHKAQQTLTNRIETSKKVKFKNLVRKSLKIAASIILMVSLSITGIYVYNEYSKVETYITYNNSPKAKKILLKDGTQVWLKQGAKLIHYSKYNKIRKVSIQGEAYFKVKRNIEKPFIIGTNKSYVKVLGTSFNLINEDLVKVTVNTGKVMIADSLRKDNYKILTKGYSASLNLKNRKILKSKNKDMNYKAWLTKKLIFKETPLNQVCKDLSRYYNCTIKLKYAKDSLKTVTTNFKNQSLENAIKAIEFVTNSELKIIKKSK